MVFLDYWGKKKERFQAIVNSENWMFSYLLLILPTSFLFVKTEESSINLWSYYSGIIPIVFCRLLAQMYPNYLDKVFYLCPFDKKDRKKYLNTAYWIRILCSVSCCILCGFVCFIFKRISILELGFSIIRILLFAVAANLEVVSAVQKGELKNFSGWMKGFCIITVLGSVWQSCIILEEGKITLTDIVGMVVLWVMQIILLIVILKKYWIKIFQYALDYEKK